MVNCKELSLEVMEIKTIPLDKYDTSGKISISPTIAETDFSPLYDDDTITIGTDTTTGSLIPIMRQTGKAKDTPTDSVAGRIRTVTVSCDIDQRDDEIWDLLLQLEREPRHIILTTRDGSVYFCQAMIDTYTCTDERDAEKVTVTFKVQCLMGLQKIIS